LGENFLGEKIKMKLKKEKVLRIRVHTTGDDVELEQLKNNLAYFNFQPTSSHIESLSDLGGDNLRRLVYRFLEPAPFPTQKSVETIIQYNGLSIWSEIVDVQATERFANGFIRSILFAEDPIYFLQGGKNVR
jgi:hypothetical protein